MGQTLDGAADAFTDTAKTFIGSRAARGCVHDVQERRLRKIAIDRDVGVEYR
jgi:hypothetical protein